MSSGGIRDDILHILEQSRFGFSELSSTSSVAASSLSSGGAPATRRVVPTKEETEGTGGRGEIRDISTRFKGKIFDARSVTQRVNQPSSSSSLSRTRKTGRREVMQRPSTSGLSRVGGGIASKTGFRGKDVGRGEFQEMKNWIKQLQKCSEKFQEQDLRAATDVDFLNAQIRAMRKAFTTLGDILLEEIDGLRTDISMDIRDSESKMSRAILELASRLDRLELRCSVNQKDTKGNKTLLQDNLNAQHGLRKDMSALQQGVREQTGGSRERMDKMDAALSEIFQKVARVETTSNEKTNDIQGRMGVYLQSLEMQIAEVLERLGSRILETERVQQRQVMLYHDVLDSISQMRVELHRSVE